MSYHRYRCVQCGHLMLLPSDMTLACEKCGGSLWIESGLMKKMGYLAVKNEVPVPVGTLTVEDEHESGFTRQRGS